MGEQSQSFFHAGNLICLLHLATDVVLKQLVSKSRVIQISRHIPWCMTLVMEIFPLLWLREFNLCEKKLVALLQLVQQGCYLALVLPELPLGCLKHGLEQRVVGEMDTPLSILEGAEREMLLVSHQHYEFVHVHTLGV